MGPRVDRDSRSPALQVDTTRQSPGTFFVSRLYKTVTKDITLADRWHW
jgi:hypothetical protein